MRHRRKSALLLSALTFLALAPATAHAGQEQPARYSIWPREVEPGGRISGFGYGVLGCWVNRVTSPGFAAEMKMASDGASHYTGSTTVILTPGRYEATFHCQEGGGKGTATFTIMDVPPSSTPPTTPPSTTKPPTTKPTPPAKPKPPVVKPRGAADTGDGSTA